MKNKNIQTEIDACFLYQKLAAHEPDALLANVFRQMSEIEKGHAEAFARKENIPLENLLQPSWRAKTLNAVGKIFGYDYVLGALMDTEKRYFQCRYLHQKKEQTGNNRRRNHPCNDTSFHT